MTKYESRNNIITHIYFIFNKSRLQILDGKLLVWWITLRYLTEWTRLVKTINTKWNTNNLAYLQQLLRSIFVEFWLF